MQMVTKKMHNAGELIGRNQLVVVVKRSEELEVAVIAMEANGGGGKASLWFHGVFLSVIGGRRRPPVG
jgi:hypothetical protein